MMIDKKTIEQCAQQSDAFYLYDERILQNQMDTLTSAFPDVQFLYSMKCNADRRVTASIFSQGFGADAASVGEVEQAVALGKAKDAIYFSAPGKTREDIARTIQSAVLIADSLDEIARIQEVASNMQLVAEIGVRINPNFSFDGSAGAASKFGIDEDLALQFLQENPYDHVRVTGLHVHLRSQSLDADALAFYYKNILALAERIEQKTNTSLAYVNLGSGIGIPYRMDEQALDIEKLSLSLNQAIADFHAALPQTRILMETGRFLVGKAGVYVTQVLDRKVSHGKTFVILKNTLNGFIRPSMACLIEHYDTSEHPASYEPFYTSRNAFQFIPLKEAAPCEKVNLVGNLCTSTDMIAEDILMPHLEAGDFIVMTNAGAYAAVLSPMQFASQSAPTAFFVDVHGTIHCEYTAAFINAADKREQAKSGESQNVSLQ